MKAKFTKPFEEYLGYLLKLTKDIVPSDKDVERCIRRSSSKIGSGNSEIPSRWTLWMSAKTRNLFDQQKETFLPGRTNVFFVEFLLSYKNNLDSRGQLPRFLKVKRPTSNRSTSSNLSSALEIRAALDFKSDFLPRSSHSSPDLNPVEFFRQLSPESFPSQSLDAYRLDQSSSLNPLASQGSCIPQSGTIMSILDADWSTFDGHHNAKADCSLPIGITPIHQYRHNLLHRERQYFKNEIAISSDIIAAVSITDEL